MSGSVSMIDGHIDEVVIKPDGIHPLSPHQFVEEEHLRNVTIQILRCEKCGHVSIGWYRQPDTEKVENTKEN